MLNEYIAKLKKLLEENNIEDKESFIEYLEEMFNDRLDAGQSEQEILNELEDPEIVVATLRKEVRQSNFSEIKKESQEQATNEEETYTFVDINSLNLDLVTAKVDISTSNNLLTTVKVFNNSSLTVKVKDKNGTLHIEEEGVSFSSGWPFSSNKRSIRIEIELADQLYNRLDLESVSGSINLNELHFDKADIEAVSGSINVSNSNFDKLSLETVSGRIKANSLIAKDKTTIETVSGSVEVFELNSENISVETVSGSITLSIDGNKEDYSIDVEKLFDETHIKKDGSKRLKIESVSGRIEYGFNY